MRDVNAETLRQWLAEGKAEIIDVRQPFEFAAAHIPGSRLVPLSQVNPAILPDGKQRKLVLVCASGARSSAACRSLGGAHAELYSLSGGLRAWQSAGGAVEGRGGGALAMLRKAALLILMLLAALAIGRGLLG